MFNNKFLYIKQNKSGFPWIFTELNNCYQWFPIISGHGTKKLLPMGTMIMMAVKTSLKKWICLVPNFIALIPSHSMAVYKNGTGTTGRGHRDACVGDLGTRDEGLEDIKYGMQGRVGQGRQIQGCRGHGMWMIFAKVGGKCDISFFVKMCCLWSTLDSIFQNHLGHLMMFTQNISL